MISVVIPNYNGKHFLKACIESLECQTFRNIEVIVVDNASSDGSIEYLNENYSHVKVIELSTNTGFSPAVNVGIKASRGEYIFLLNNDTEIDSECIAKLYDFIQKDKSIFSVNSKMVQYNNRQLLDDAGDEYNIFGWAFKRGFNQSVHSNVKPRRVFSCCGGASLYRKSILNEIGFFDEAFFAYLEDVDIGYRANCYGYKNYYCPDAIVYHIISGTTGNKKSEFKTKLSARNNTYLIYKNMTKIQVIINSPFLIIGLLTKTFFFSKYGYGRIYFIESIKAFKNVKTLNRADFKINRIKYYIWIQFKLMCNVIIFVYERLLIKLNKGVKR